MAEYIEDNEMQEEVVDTEEEALEPSIPRLLRYSATDNIGFELDERTLDEIGMSASDDYEADKSSRAEWEEKVEKWVEIATQVKEEKSYPWEGAANVKYPLLSEAALQFNARAFPALFPGKKIVKAAITGDDVTGEKMERAERISDHMSYQLTEEIVGWEEEMDAALLVLPIVGCFFKKTFWDHRAVRPKSTVVWAQDLVVNDDYRNIDIEDVPCISEPFELFPKDVQDKMRTGEWLDVDLYESIEDEDVDYGEAIEFVEQHRLIDLDKDGYPEPYIVTFHTGTKKVVKISARYDEDNIKVKRREELVSVGQIMREWQEINKAIQLSNQQAEAMQMQAVQTGQQVPAFVPQDPVPQPDVSGWDVATIDGECLYTKYYFFPSADGSFYAMGLGELTQSIGETIDTGINQMLDAATLANIQGGFKAKEAKVPAGQAKVKAGEWTNVETHGAPLKESFMPFNFRGPVPSSFNLLSFLLDAGKGLTSVQDIMTGETDPNETATTTMIKREEGQRVFNAVYKRIYRSFKKELQKLYRLNAKYLKDQTYMDILDNQKAIARQDYTVDETDVQPVADPSVSSLAQKIAQAQMLMQFIGDPEFNATEIKRNFLEAAQVPNIDLIMPPKDPNAPPDPGMIMQMQTMMKQMEKLQAEIDKLNSETIENIATAEEKGAKVEIETIKALREVEGGQGETGGMAGQSANTGGAERNIPAPTIPIGNDTNTPQA